MTAAPEAFDVAVLGGGIAGMATAARLQAGGVSTVVIERHGQVGGCAGFFRQRGFAFDVGATTLVDFERGGLGGDLLDEVGICADLEPLPGYIAHLPGRTITLSRDTHHWKQERASQIGDTPAHRRLFALLDELADVFWAASRRGLTLPIRTVADLSRAMRCVPARHWTLARFVGATLGETLRAHGLYEDVTLRGLLSILVEDTVHARLDDAPLVNAALGITIRGAGLSRARGGMFGFWSRFVDRYRALGGTLRRGTRVLRVAHEGRGYVVQTSRGSVHSAQIVSALPLEVLVGIAPVPVVDAIQPFVERDRGHRGGALVMFLGVHEHEVAGRAWTHHQMLDDVRAPLGDGNNMFVSVSSPGDDESAPLGHRAVMLSTHCELAEWSALDNEVYAQRKAAASARLLGCARRAYPRLGESPLVCELGTPVTYERYTGRPRGAVGGARLTPSNSNQRAAPHDIGVDGFYLVGDDTWPGLGTVAACLASRDVATRVLAKARKEERRSSCRTTRHSGIARFA